MVISTSSPATNSALSSTAFKVSPNSLCSILVLALAPRLNSGGKEIGAFQVPIAIRFAAAPGLGNEVHHITGSVEFDPLNPAAASAISRIPSKPCGLSASCVADSRPF
jgi:hypothetical protein